VCEVSAGLSSEIFLETDRLLLRFTADDVENLVGSTAIPR
jgi:hypothetical protein